MALLLCLKRAIRTAAAHTPTQPLHLPIRCSAQVHWQQPGLGGSPEPSRQYARAAAYCLSTASSALNIPCCEAGYFLRQRISPAVASDYGTLLPACLGTIGGSSIPGRGSNSSSSSGTGHMRSVYRDATRRKQPWQPTSAQPSRQLHTSTFSGATSAASSPTVRFDGRRSAPCALNMAISAPRSARKFSSVPGEGAASHLPLHVLESMENELCTHCLRVSRRFCCSTL